MLYSRTLATINRLMQKSTMFTPRLRPKLRMAHVVTVIAMFLPSAGCSLRVFTRSAARRPKNLESSGTLAVVVVVLVRHPKCLWLGGEGADQYEDRSTEVLQEADKYRNFDRQTRLYQTHNCCVIHVTLHESCRLHPYGCE